MMLNSGKGRYRTKDAIRLQLPKLWNQKEMPNITHWLLCLKPSLLRQEAVHAAQDYLLCLVL